VAVSARGHGVDVIAAQAHELSVPAVAIKRKGADGEALADAALIVFVVAVIGSKLGVGY
jgi:hypothetical protein